MARYSPVGPIQWLEQLQDVNLLGDYLLLLAHEVLESPERYRTLMKRVRDNSHNPFIILDNSVIELGAALPTSYMKEACDIIQPTCVVLTDVMEDGERTVAAAADAHYKYRSAGILCSTMAVIQGNDIPQLMWCAQQLAMSVNPTYWGLPRIVANNVGTRKVFENILGLNFTGLKPRAHLLGMSQRIRDDVLCTQMPGIIGIDSANPLILGQKGILITRDNYQHVSREGVWGNEPLTPIALENVERVREWVR